MLIFISIGDKIELRPSHVTNKSKNAVCDILIDDDAPMVRKQNEYSWIYCLACKGSGQTLCPTNTCDNHPSCANLLIVLADSLYETPLEVFHH